MLFILFLLSGLFFFFLVLFLFSKDMLNPLLAFLLILKSSVIVIIAFLLLNSQTNFFGLGISIMMILYQFFFIVISCKISRIHNDTVLLLSEVSIIDYKNNRKKPSN